MRKSNGLRVKIAISIIGTALHLAQTNLHGEERFRDTEVDCYNVRVGTQTFSPRYRFGTNSSLVETASAIREMGSDILKFYMGRGFAGQYGVRVHEGITSLKELAAEEPSCRKVLDMPFRHFLVWAYCFSAAGDAAWKDGLSAAEKAAEFKEIYEFVSDLLTRYNGSGKTFYVGHWEGDWHLLDSYDASKNPSPEAIGGMIEWLNTRQSAVDTALRETPHTNVFVYHYTEVNRVRDAMLNDPARNQRLVNAVLPYVENIDFVSWSAYDGMDLSAQDLWASLDYIESKTPINKAAVITGRRVWIGEYGWGGTLASQAQEAPTRNFISRVLPWNPRFILFWQMYDNEGRSYWLIDSNNVKTACYDLHSRFINLARLRTSEFKHKTGRLPRDSEFAQFMVRDLVSTLPRPKPLAISGVAVTTSGREKARLVLQLQQEEYGSEPARIFVFYGENDAGTNVIAWQQSSWSELQWKPGTAELPLDLSNLKPNTTYYSRCLASNSVHRVWAKDSVRFRTGSEVTENPQ